MRTDSVLQKYTHYIIHTLMTGMYNVTSEDRLHNYLDTTLNKKPRYDIRQYLISYFLSHFGFEIFPTVVMKLYFTFGLANHSNKTLKT